jgi:hypothetical protein
MIGALRMIGIIGLTGGLGIIGMIGCTGGRGLHCPIATPFTKARSVSCRVSASEAPVSTGVANIAAHRRSAHVVIHVSRRAVCEGFPRGHVVATPGKSWVQYYTHEVYALRGRLLVMTDAT